MVRWRASIDARYRTEIRTPSSARRAVPNCSGWCTSEARQCLCTFINAWVARWSGLFAVAAQQANAASLHEPLPSTQPSLTPGGCTAVDCKCAQGPDRSFHAVAKRCAWKAILAQVLLKGAGGFVDVVGRASSERMQPVCVTLNLGRNSVTAALQGEYLMPTSWQQGGGMPPSNLPQHRRHLLRHSVSRRHPRPLGADPQQNPWWWQPAATLPRTTRRSTAAARSGTALPRSALPLDLAGACFLRPWLALGRCFPSCEACGALPRAWCFGPCCSVHLCRGLTCAREGSCQFFRLLVLAFVSRALRPRLPRAPVFACSASACTWALRAAAAHCALALLPHPALVSRGCLSEAPVSNRLSGAELPSQVFAAELCARALLRGQVVSTPFRAYVSCDIRQLGRAPRARAAARISGFSEPGVHILTALRGC